MARTTFFLATTTLLFAVSNSGARTLCAYDASLCLSVPEKITATHPDAFKNSPRKPLLFLEDKSRLSAPSRGVILILTGESGGNARQAAQKSLQEMRLRLSDNPAFRPDEGVSALPLRKDLPAYYYDNGCVPEAKCNSMKFIFFLLGNRVLQASCPPSDLALCRQILATIRAPRRANAALTPDPER